MDVQIWFIFSWVYYGLSAVVFPQAVLVLPQLAAVPGDTDTAAFLPECFPFTESGLWGWHFHLRSYFCCVLVIPKLSVHVGKDVFGIWTDSQSRSQCGSVLDSLSDPWRKNRCFHDKAHVVPNRYPSEHRDDALGVPFALCKGQSLWGWCQGWSAWCLWCLWALGCCPGCTALLASPL